MSAHPLRNKAAIVGVGESEIGKVPHMTGLALNAQAAKRALDDAGLAMAQVDGFLTAYSVTEPYPMLATVLTEYLGLRPRYGASLVTGGATPAIMLSHAAQAVATGMANVVLVTAGENRATGISRDQAVRALSAFGGHPYFEDPYGPIIPACYAMIARRYMHDYGVAREDLARVSVQSRAHACRHPNAHMRKPITVDDVLASKPIAEPLNLLDCCLISDAAGAFVVTSADQAKDLKSNPVYLLGAGEAHPHEHILAAPSLTEFGTRQSSAQAYAMAGLGPRDIDFAELYDCFSVVPILEAEEVGLAPRGEGAALWREGRAAIEGELPINTHGGMLSHAHAGAAGGLFGIVEAVRQLRGGAGERQVKRHEIALVHNEGGILSSHGTVILGAQPV
jgi:acetyl-CoA acetyltransferase